MCLGFFKTFINISWQRKAGSAVRHYEGSDDFKSLTDFLYS